MKKIHQIIITLFILIHTFSLRTLPPLHSNPLKSKILKDTCESNIENCLKCDFNKKDCIECEKSFYITQEGHCQKCMDGCLQCFKEEKCVQCNRFYKKDPDTSICFYSYAKLAPFFILSFFFLVCFGLALYWLCLRFRNKRSANLLKRKTESARNDPLLSPAFLSRKSTSRRTKKTMISNFNDGSI